ncbi:MAG: tRNA lysidine(34) synthetase TilS [Firmicutes bacterium]|nr:tRNA lysidine(34) synthetase TilS [Bacillota bacterium]
MMALQEGSPGKEQLTLLAATIAGEIRNRQMILPGDRVIVGLSGGPDSVCLLSILAELREPLGIRSLHAVHINHGLRGAESDGDQDYAEEVAGQLGATFDAVRYDIRKVAGDLRLGEEETGRKLRYETFEKFRKQYGAQRIAVAHNRNDQAETVLMRLLRGTGIRGLSGISWTRDGGVIIRPLLGTERRDIEKYCRMRGLTPRIDSSNLDALYTRNRLRLQLIPRLEKEYNPRLQESLARLAEQAAETDDYVKQAAWDYLDSADRPNGSSRWRNEDSSLDPDGFGALHKAVSGRVVLEILDRAGLAGSVSADLIDRVRNTALSEKEPAEADLSDHWYVRKIYGRLWFLRRDQFEDRIIKEPVLLPLETLEKEGIAELQAGSIRILLSLTVWEPGRDPLPERKKRKGFAVLDFDRIVSGGVPVFRNRKPGDRFRPVGMKGRKKLQDFFTDRKIPRQQRDSVLLLARENEIFLAGTEVSCSCAVTEETRRVLRLQFSDGPNGVSYKVWPNDETKRTEY